MARKPYSENQSINSMTTRQLRQYIADKAEDAQERLDTINLDEASKAFQNAASRITKGSKVKKSTSNMSKVQMQDYAYRLDNFIAMDIESGFAKSLEWKRDKASYEGFIKKQIERNPKSYWAKYKTEKGNISKKGYEEYKEYIVFIRSLEDITAEYTYETVSKYGKQAIQESPERARFVSQLMIETFKKSKKEGWDQGRLNKEFKKALKKYDDAEAEKKTKPKTTKGKKKSVPKKVKTSKAKSTNEVKVKQAGKMRTDGTIREQLT